MNYLDWIAKWSSYTPDKTAVVSFETGESYTYNELNERALQVETVLIETYAVTKGDRVAVLAEHSPEYLILFIATQRLGAVLVPLNYRCTTYEIMHCITDVSPVLILTDCVRFRKMTQLLKKRTKHPVVSFPSFITQAKQLETYSVSAEREIDVDRPIFIFYTSGSTGIPKGVIYTNRMMFWNSLNTAVQLEITSSDHTVNCLPPYHTSGWNVLLLPMLHRGARVDFCKRFKPEKVLNYLQEEPVSLFLAVPTMLRMMIQTNSFKSFKAKKLKYIVAGGENLSTAIIDAWAEKKILIRQGYGLTEAGPSITSLHHHDALWKKGSVGKPNFYVEIKIVNKKNEEVNTGEAGELCIRGQIVTPGYWNNSACTAEKIRDGWFYTGDFVRRDRDGFIYVEGRKSQVFISGGENVHPAEIERVLCQLSTVQEAVVVGVEDEVWGEKGVAFVVPGTGTIGEKELLADLRKFLAPYKVPQKVIFVKSLPRTGLGKIDRKKLMISLKTEDNDKKDVV